LPDSAVESDKFHFHYGAIARLAKTLCLVDVWRADTTARGLCASVCMRQRVCQRGVDVVSILGVGRIGLGLLMQACIRVCGMPIRRFTEHDFRWSKCSSKLYFIEHCDAGR